MARRITPGTIKCETKYGLTYNHPTMTQTIVKLNGADESYGNTIVKSILMDTDRVHTATSNLTIEAKEDSTIHEVIITINFRNDWMEAQLAANPKLNHEIMRMKVLKDALVRIRTTRIQPLEREYLLACQANGLKIRLHT